MSTDTWIAFGVIVGTALVLLVALGWGDAADHRIDDRPAPRRRGGRHGR